MAMTSGGSSGSRTYSYTVTETYTLEEAVGKASRGSLSPDEVYRQMPGSLQGEVDQVASRTFHSPFSSLTVTQQREVMGTLSSEIKRAKEQSKKGVSIADALQLAGEGKLDDMKLYRALPDELRKVLDALAGSLSAASFTVASPEARKQIIKSVLMMLSQQGDGNEAHASHADRGLELHNRALQLKSQGDAGAALATMREAERILAADAGAATKPSNASVAVSCNLSSALANVGDWADDTPALQAAIAAVDRGLTMIEKLPQPPKFELAVLLHNRGLAGWRLGELTGSNVTLAHATEDLKRAGEVFESLQNSEAVTENAGVLSKAHAALTRL
jgi:hypothetical protein